MAIGGWLSDSHWGLDGPVTSGDGSSSGAQGGRFGICLTGAPARLSPRCCP